MELDKSLLAFLRVSKCFCLLPFELSDSKGAAEFTLFRKTPLYIFRTCLLLATVVAANLYKQIAMDVYKSQNAIGNAVEFAHYNCRLLGAMSCIILLNFRNGPLVAFMNGVLDLQEKFRGFGCAVRYHKMASLGRLAIWVLVLQSMTMCGPYLAAPQDLDFNTTLDFLNFAIPLILVHITCLQWVIYLMLLRIYVQALNNLLKNLKHRQCWVIEDFSTGSPTSAVLESCGELYGKLCSGSRSLNEAFSWQFLFILPGFFIELVLKSFSICQSIKNKAAVTVDTVVSDVVHFLVVLLILVPCAVVQEEAARFVDTLAEVDLESRLGRKFEEAMSALMLQVHHQRIEFSANGVFALDGTLIYSILGALTTYLVILLQFDM